MQLVGGTRRARKLLQDVGNIKSYVDPNYKPRDCRYLGSDSGCVKLNETFLQIDQMVDG